LTHVNSQGFYIVSDNNYKCNKPVYLQRMGGYHTSYSEVKQL